VRDEDKPFICYRQGRWGMKIVPRNAAGWRAVIIWVFALMVISVPFVFAMGKQPTGILSLVSLLLYAVAISIWSFALVRWTKQRSEIVDLDELLKIKRERDKAAKNTGR
jgi:hypothetical protein